jgi:choice-of-anchor B domain-containing protein
MKVLSLLVVIFTVGVLSWTCQEDPACIRKDDDYKPLMNKVMPLKNQQWEVCAAAGLCPNINAVDLNNIPCVDGQAGEYPCSNVDLLSFISLNTLSAGNGNDIWGWVGSTGREYAIMGTYDRTVFVDVTDPINPSFLGYLLTHTIGSSWRDIKVYQSHAFIISEAPDHGMQIFDLRQLENIPRIPLFDSNYNLSVPISFPESAWYGQFGSCHNLAINEESGYAYAVGSRTCNGGGLHVVNIQNPKFPEYAGCFGDDGYVHDTQCVNYDGPDTKYTGKEICFCYNEDSLTIVDVSVKTAQMMISRISYQGVQYTHQGWLIPSKTHLLMDDELDELENPVHNTRTMVWDVTTLEEPKLVSDFYSTEEVIDHNLYTLNDRAYLSNYCGGLRIYDISDPLRLTEAGYFDVAPTCSTRLFLGTWSNYPYFPSGNIVVSSIDRGLFVLKYNRE